jgi:hypothetical protein
MNALRTPAYIRNLRHWDWISDDEIEEPDSAGVLLYGARNFPYYMEAPLQSTPRDGVNADMWGHLHSECIIANILLVLETGFC